MEANAEQVFLECCREQFGWTRYPMTQDMNLAELVARIQESGQKIARKLLETRLLEDPRTHPAKPGCPECGNKLRIQETAQRRVLNTGLGEIEYQRAYGVCDRCGYSGAPLDEGLGIPHSGPSVGTLRKVCHAALIAGSFEKGEDVLKEHGDIRFCRQYVRTR